ncbi:MAG: hypothetical protein GX491_04040 [Chloroflexi bacterium]|nr:hypothetical protein [Chloroflexota bacterium]
MTTGLIWMDWAVQAVSLFNAVVLVWLGLTVLLNADRRTGGIWLAGGGLLMGGAFFISHSALLGHETSLLTTGQDFWWFAGWALVICLPFAWYIVMLWYTGFWEARRAEAAAERQLFQRQQIWFALTMLFFSLLSGAVLFTPLLPPFTQLAQAGSTPAAGVTALSALYPIYALLCMGLSIDALRNPGPSRRWLGETARRRAQPWLLATSMLLLVVSLLVGWAMNWIVLSLGRGTAPAAMILPIGIFDLVISSLIAASVVVLGQAVVSYEIFTARTLPRNGLFQHWRRALILAAGYSALVAWTLAIHLRPVYSLLLTTLLMTVFFAMLAWRSYAERERFLHSLRPFLGAPEVYTSILSRADSDRGLDVSRMFTSLCRDVLETRRACLAPLGALASLAGPPVCYPDQVLPEPPPLAHLAAVFTSPDEKGLPLDPGQSQGFIWAVPLWSERGLIGVLLLAEKRTGGLYSQEEIEMARAAGERLLDLQAGAELARRLAVLERQHLAQNQVLDQQARRILHDEILPLVHTALLRLTASASPGAEESISLLTQVHKGISDLLRAMPSTLSPEIHKLGFVGALRKVVESDLAGKVGCCGWQVEPDAAALLERLPQLESEVLFYAAREALRNAARYGNGSSGRAEIAVRIIAADGLRIVIENQASTEPLPEPASSGQGIALHSTLMAVVGGALSLEHSPGQMTRVVLSLPHIESL